MALAYDELLPDEQQSLRLLITETVRAHNTERLECHDHEGLCCPAPGCRHDMTYREAERHAAEAVAVAVLEVHRVFEVGRGGAIDWGPVQPVSRDGRRRAEPERTAVPAALPDGTAVNALHYALRDCGDHAETIGTAWNVDPQWTVAELLTRMYDLGNPNPYTRPIDPRDSWVEMRLAVTEWPLPRPADQDPANTAEGPF